MLPSRAGRGGSDRFERLQNGDLLIRHAELLGPDQLEPGNRVDAALFWVISLHSPPIGRSRDGVNTNDEGGWM